jgi:hypothetical protein
MERHDTMPFARCVLGAGTFAVAMAAMTGAATAQTSVCYAGGEGDPTFCGHVFTDTSSDGNWDGGEGVPGIDVAITDTSGNNVANSPTPTAECAPDPDGCGEFGGYYSFVVPDPTPGTDYWICLVTDPAQSDCRDSSAHPDAVKVTVGTSLPFVDFEVGGGSEDPDPGDVWGVGTGTPGYWKNHAEAWPVEGVTVGGILYKGPTINNAIKLMGKVGGDKSLTMFASLISAKLNTMLANNTACIAATIALADAWITAHPAGSGVKGSSAAWAAGQEWHQKMDDYNNGKLCAPHRD